MPVGLAGATVLQSGRDHLPAFLAHPTAAPAAAAPTAATSAAGAVLPVSGVASAAQVAPILAAAQAALAKTVNLSPQAQQAIKAEALPSWCPSWCSRSRGHGAAARQLAGGWGHSPVAGLAGRPGAAGFGRPAAAAATAQRAVPPAALPRRCCKAGPAVRRGHRSRLQPHPRPLLLRHRRPQVLRGSGAAASPGASGAAGQTAGAGTPAATVRPALPALQNWLVQQGVLQGPMASGLSP
jgi:hypothetical protein